MKTLKGLIIRENSRGESSKSVSVLCAELGVIDVFIRGGMKSGKTASSTQLFTYSTLCLEEKRDAHGHTNYYLNSAETENMFYHLRLDVKKTTLASYFSDLLCFSRIENADCNEILKLTLNTLYFLDKGDREPDLLKSIFEFRLLCELGFRPYLVGCNHCFAYESNEMHFNFKSGLLECENCCINPDSIYDFTFDRTLLYIVRYIALTDYNQLFNFKINEKYQEKLTEFTERFVKYYFTDNFQTLRFYKLL
ncbi:MAG: DNA repair protein RecO [Oscillospiraceae bacterium]